MRRDLTSIETLYSDAFPDEDLLPLVVELLHEPALVLSLVATFEDSIVGHVLFTRCGLAGGSKEFALLGPLAVVPARQRQGIGGALVRAGFERQRSLGRSRVFVLGDPRYYGRFGFLPESKIMPPYLLPVEWREAWQSRNVDGAEPIESGELLLPGPWRQPALWAP